MPDDPALLAYEAMAPIYDEFNAQNDYEAWFDVLLPRLEGLGLKHGSLLDVACGTGKTVEPMLRRGWAVRGCDIAPKMVELARAKFPDVTFDVADMRELSVYSEGGFQLVWALNDPVNYLLETADLERALAAMAANLADDGLLVFDTNTSALMRGSFEPEEGLSRGERWQWKGAGQVNGLWEAELSGDGVEAHVHRERHHSVPEVQAAMRSVGLVPLAAMGHSEDEVSITIADDWDEERDLKIIHACRAGS